jgi:hypothetical protein
MEFLGFDATRGAGRAGTAVAVACATVLAAAAGPVATATLAIPQRANANVSVAADGAFVTAVWSAAATSGDTDIFAAVSVNGGRAFSTPVRVNDVAGEARVNGEQPPRVALVHRAGATPGIAIVWTAKGAQGTTLRQARSDDAGRSFGPAVIVPGSDAPGNRGWEAAAADTHGHVNVAWLDHRELVAGAAQMPAMHHDTGAGRLDGVAMAERSKLFFAAADGSVPPHAVTRGVCYCCKTALVSGGDGVVYTAWRHVYPGNLRDIAFALSRDGGRTFAAPVRVSEDKWMLEGCPDDGPAMVVDRQNRVHIVWPTLVQQPGADAEPALALFYATSTDGRTFTPRMRIPTEGMPHHPQAALDAAGGLAVAWDEATSGTRRVAFAHAPAPGAGGRGPVFVREVLSAAGPALYPVVAATNDGVVVAWTAGGPADSVIRVAVR